MPAWRIKCVQVDSKKSLNERVRGVSTIVKNPGYKPILFFSYFAGIYLLVITYFQWELIDKLTPFLMPAVYLTMIGLMAGAVIPSLIVLFTNWKTMRWRALHPLAVVGIAILIWIVVPMTNLYLDVNWMLKQHKYDTVAALIEKGELVPDSQGHLTLPEEYKSLSIGGGEVIVEGPKDSQTILFFSFRGILDNYSGYVYTVKDTAPQDEDYFQVIKKKDHWYWVASR